MYVTCATVQGLRDMGYRLSDDELQRLMNAIGGTHDSVSRSTIMASQIDWRHLQVRGLHALYRFFYQSIALVP